MPSIPVLDPVHVFGASLIQGPGLIAADDILNSRSHHDLGARHTGSSHTTDDHLDIFHLLADDLERIDQGRKHNYRGAMLIVVEHRNIEFFLQSLFNLKTSGR